jgi:hypothetical protein
MTAHPLTRRAGLYSALFNTAVGSAYLVVILAALLTGRFAFPPPEGLQLFGGITSLLFCPGFVLTMAALHRSTPEGKRVLSQAALGFTLLFALAVSINRFNQLGVVRQAQAAGRVEGIDWFLAYGDYSIMLGLEYLGWAWFLGFALLCAAPLFWGGGRLERWLCGCAVLYAGLALVSALGFGMGSWLALLGFAAWGVVLLVFTGLMAAYFWRLSTDF